MAARKISDVWTDLNAKVATHISHTLDVQTVTHTQAYAKTQTPTARSRHAASHKPLPLNIPHVWPFNCGPKISVIMETVGKHSGRNRHFSYYIQVCWCQGQLSILSWQELLACVTAHHNELAVEREHCSQISQLIHNLIYSAHRSVGSLTLFSSTQTDCTKMCHYGMVQRI